MTEQEKELEKLKIMTGERDETLLSLLLEDAESFALSYTNRKEMVPGMKRAVRDLAVIAWNRMGTEGEASRSGGGESYSFDNAPKHIYDVLNRYRLCRVGGKAYEIKTKSDSDVLSSDSDR